MPSTLNPSEVMDVVLIIAAIPILMGVLGRMPHRRNRGFWTGYLLLLAASIATIVEGYLLPDLVNALEHVLYALSGTAFAFALWPSSGHSVSRSA